MSNSIYHTRRVKIAFDDPKRFRIGDEFYTKDGKLVYLRLVDLKA